METAGTEARQLASRALEGRSGSRKASCFLGFKGCSRAFIYG